MGMLGVILLLLCSIVLATPVVHGIEEGPEAVEEWFQMLSHKKEKVTKLHFYFHDIVSGKNPTAVLVAKPQNAPQSPNVFGAVSVMDDALTAGPELNSTIVGRAQGIYADASLGQVAHLLPLNFVFTTGKYNGSTLSVLGRDPILNQYRELSIVGGSGVFRLARGTATAKTYTFNMTSGDATVEYHVIVLHY